MFRDLLSQRGRALDEIVAACDHLLAMPESTGAIGIAGFRMGGQFALVVSPKGFGASAPFYGTPLPRNLGATLDGACPIVASFGRRDPIEIGAADRLRAVLDEQNIPADVKVYPEAGHSFVNQLPAQPLIRITGFGFTRPPPRTRGPACSHCFDQHLYGTPAD